MPFCARCGGQLPQQAAFCGHCGAPVRPPATAPAAPTAAPTATAPVTVTAPETAPATLVAPTAAWASGGTPATLSDSSENPPATEANDSKSAATGLGLIGAAAAVFTVCSLVQGAFGSSMFSSSYRDPGLLGGLLINLTFQPGWTLTILLAVAGLFSLWTTLSKG